MLYNDILMLYIYIYISIAFTFPFHVRDFYGVYEERAHILHSDVNELQVHCG